ncbi:LCP family protein [Nocardioides sp. T2.26MG-1]|uniref:LCP family protein n=1 Tax=Nocardioides sp. T2.26MG-1 TaxID=3041166 RepID=UPI00247791AE|nr:LCP family protein [Nocardioides sp. T2.26MG-1]CAI9408285.1 Polyisoprenyl-teichoic acid--peptidoglycan teichoic acid transferase TagU [Nocardioides sp. T2.26MG-1]
MPPVSSPGSLDSQVPRFTAGDRAARVRFRRALALMLMTLLLPGSAQLVAGNRKVGLIALRIWFVVVTTFVVTVVAAFFWHRLAFEIGFDPAALFWLRLALMALATGWALLFFDAWRLGQPLTLTMGHRRAAVGLNGVLALSVAAALLFGAHLVGAQRDFVLAMSGDGGDTGAHDGRYNVLLLGGDSGAGRWGLRPDSMTVASIDAETGRTVLISLPRNMQNFPFVKGSVMHEQFPDGFDADYLNGVSTWAGDNTELFPDSANPGVDATIMAIEGITGLRINYWAMVNLEGFKDLVDAVGGVTLNVRQEIPVGLPQDSFYSHIEPGVQKLNGFETLWFARARYDSDDYSRMARQKCVMNAMLQQISPQTAVRNFASIAQASSAMVSTNIPAGEFGHFAELALKARGQRISTLSLVPPMIDTAHPDIKLVRKKVAEAIDRADGTAPPPAKPKKHADDPVTGGSIGSLGSGYAANEADDLDSAC